MVLSSFGLVFLMGILGATASVFIGEWVLEMMYGAEFSARADVLPIIALAAAITYLANIIGYAINAKRIFMAQAPAQLLVVLGSVLGAWYYVPTYGLDGAAYVLVLSSVIMFTSFLGVLFLYRHK
jgi:O-antigen/teichoic acid export membrane protein